MKIIKINSPKYGNFKVKVDDGDYEYLTQFTWIIVKTATKKLWYAQRTVYDKLNKKYFTIRMTRDILKLKNPSLFVDHIDRDGLNNQRKNLRVVNKQQNCFNRSSLKGVKSKYKGVSMKQNTSNIKFWFSAIKYNYINYHLGKFPYTKEGEIAAAKRYDLAAKYFFEEFANLNFKEK